MDILAFIVVGLIAGVVASYLMKVKTGIWVDLILGVVGSLLGGWLSNLVLGIDLVSGLNLTSILVSIAGALLVIYLYRLFRARQKGK